MANVDSPGNSKFTGEYCLIAAEIRFLLFTMNKHVRWLSVLSLCLISTTQGEESAVVNASKINVRGQPTLNSEVVTQLEKGDKVTIIEVIPDSDAKKNEPANWAKIKLPENTPVWLFAPFVKDGEVNVNRLNLRAGPGERYSVVGRVERGTKVKTIRTVESWMEIEAPENAYAFVGLSLLDRKDGTSAATAAANPKTTPSTTTKTAIPPAVSKAGPVTNTTTAQPRVQTSSPGTGALALPGTRPVTNAEPSLPATSPGTTTAAVPTPGSERPRTSTSPTTAQPSLPSDTRQAKAAPVTPPATTTASPVTTPTTTAKTATPPAQLPELGAPEEEPEPKELPKRVVRREGFVRPTRSIQAPTPFALVSPNSGKSINYLYGDEIGLNLGEFRDMKVIVTGEEGIDERWPNTPVLKIETIDTAP